MAIRAKYVHTNLIAGDWRALSRFYVDILGCVPVPPERDFRGAQIEAGTGLAGIHVQGMHLRLPGCGDGGPTLEIFSYDPLLDRGKPALNTPGYGHVAFLVEDVVEARKQVLGAGGGAMGEVVTTKTADGTRITWCYLTDPEGNVIELQSVMGPE